MNLGIIHLSDIHFRQDQPEGASAIINALINSFYLGDLYDVLDYEIKKGFVSDKGNFSISPGDY